LFYFLLLGPLGPDIDDILAPNVDCGHVSFNFCVRPSLAVEYLNWQMLFARVSVWDIMEAVSLEDISVNIGDYVSELWILWTYGWKIGWGGRIPKAFLGFFLRAGLRFGNSS
jgi:hypothetical protein